MQFKLLLDQWVQEQRRKIELGKLKPASLAAFTSYVNVWIRPHLGEIEVEAVLNGVVKQFAETVAAAGRSPKTVREIVALVKVILESHVDANGKPLLDLDWRPKFIFKNVREIKDQNQPTVTKDALNTVLKNRNLSVQSRVLVALAASTGLRVGELTAIKINGSEQDTSWDAAASTIYVRKSLWHGQVQLPKTEASVRLVDLSKPVNDMLVKFTAGRQPGEWLFSTTSGKPLTPKSIEQQITKPNGIPGMHSLRRFRISYLRGVGCNEMILKRWLGHSSGSGDTTNRYDKSAENIALRQSWAERIGTGLEIIAATHGAFLPKSKPPEPAPLPSDQQLVLNVASAALACLRFAVIPYKRRARYAAELKTSVKVKHTLVKRKRRPNRKSLDERLIKPAEKDLPASTFVAAEDDLPAELSVTEEDLARAKAELESLR